jgi:hypothetical protein
VCLRRGWFQGNATLLNQSSEFKESG